MVFSNTDSVSSSHPHFCNDTKSSHFLDSRLFYLYTNICHWHQNYFLNTELRPLLMFAHYKAPVVPFSSQDEKPKLLILPPSWPTTACDNIPPWSHRQIWTLPIPPLPALLFCCSQPTRVPPLPKATHTFPVPFLIPPPLPKIPSLFFVVIMKY